MRLKVVNLDHTGTLPGGVGMGHDRACVLDLDRLEPHPVTGKLQPAMPYLGTLSGAWAFLSSKRFRCSACGSYGPIGESCGCFDNGCQ